MRRKTGPRGAAVGAALTGMRPVVVHPRMDFMLYAFDPIINQAANWHFMSGGTMAVPVVFWGIVNRGGEQAAQHSQALHSMFCHVPGLKVVAPSCATDAKGLMIAAIQDDDPVVFGGDVARAMVTDVAPMFQRLNLTPRWARFAVFPTGQTAIIAEFRGAAEAERTALGYLAISGLREFASGDTAQGFRAARPGGGRVHVQSVGRHLGVWGDKGTQPGGFGDLKTGYAKHGFGPIGVMVDKHDRVWVSSLNDRVQAFTPGGRMCALAGFMYTSRSHSMASSVSGE